MSRYRKRFRRSKPVTRSTPPPAPWSLEALVAYDAYAQGRNLPPLIALNLRRFEPPDIDARGVFLLGVFDLRICALHATIWGCMWFSNNDDEAWVKLPSRMWIDQHDQKHYERVLSFDDLYTERFEEAAMTALGILLDSEPPWRAKWREPGALASAEPTPASPLTNGHDQPEGEIVVASEDSEQPPPRTNGHLVEGEGGLHEPPF